MSKFRCAWAANSADNKHSWGIFAPPPNSPVPQESDGSYFPLTKQREGAPVEDSYVLLAGKSLDKAMGAIRDGSLHAYPCGLSSLSRASCVSSLTELRRFNFGPISHLFGITPADPLQIAVTSPELRGRPCEFEFSLFPQEFPAGTLMQLPGNILVPSFEQYFIQKARSLKFEHLVLLGMELCGRYAHRTPGIGSTTCDYLVDSAMSADSLRAHIKKASGMMGSKQARVAAQWIIDNAYSPRESVIALEQYLQPRRGGRGYPMPKLNIEVDIPPSLRGLAARDVFMPDIYWEGMLDVEYDSGYHNERDQIEKDKARVADIQAVGIPVISATRLSLSTCERAELLGRQIGAKLAESLGTPMRRHLSRLNSTVRQAERAQLHVRLMRLIGTPISNLQGNFGFDEQLDGIDLQPNFEFAADPWPYDE